MSGRAARTLLVACLVLLVAGLVAVDRWRHPLAPPPPSMLGEARGFSSLPLPVGAHASAVEATADGYVQQQHPAETAGLSDHWLVQGGARAKRGYLTFELPPAPRGTTVTEAMLYATVETDSPADPQGFTVHRTASGWREVELAWESQHETGARVATTDPSYSAGVDVVWEVSGALTPRERRRGGTVSFVVSTEEPRAVSFASRESGRSPVLRVTTATPGPRDGVQAATVHRWGPVVAGDEFDVPGAPDPTRWAVYHADGHDGRGVRHPEAWRVERGRAIVTGDPSGVTGGMAARFDRRRYGRWEVRMRTNARDPEYHPVLLLWPDDRTVTTCPEVDFAEGSRATTRVSFYNHHACGGVHTWARRHVSMTRWHNYAVEWTPRGITGYVDGVPWFRDRDPDHQPPGSMHVALQLDWMPDDSGVLTESRMEVDWVRVYDLT